MRYTRLLPVVLLVACGGDDSGSPTQPATPVATTIELSASSVALESLGATSTLTATVKDQNGGAMTGQTVTWSSSDDGVATVSDGTVTAVANGSATITGTSGSANASASVTVSQTPASITLSADSVRLAMVGDTLTLVATVADAGGSTIDGAAVSWVSSDTLVVTVDAAGLVTSAGPGVGSISASSGSASVAASVVSVPFYLADNGVTVICSIAEVGDTATVNGVLYTKMDRAGLDALVSAQDYAPLSATCTTGVTNLADLLAGQALFNEPIGSWDVSAVVDMDRLFNGAAAFDQPLESWDVSKVQSMSQLFRDAAAFNQPLAGWDVSSVVDMGNLFRNATSFNQPIGSWDVGQVTDMGNLFYGATSFDQPLEAWDVGSATNMVYMFRGATSFNRPIGSWDVSSVEGGSPPAASMEGMFWDATTFDQDLSGWCVTNVPGAPASFDSNTPAWSLPRPVWGSCSPASTVQTTGAADPGTIPANGLATTTLTVQLKDVSGADITSSAGDLTFDTPSQGSVGPVTDNGDGSYSAVYTAGTSEGTVTLTPSIDGGLKVLPSVDVILSPTFFLAANGVTVVCTDAQVGGTGVVNGITYTKRDRAGLEALVAGGNSSGDFSPLATSCTTGVVDMSSLIASNTFNEDIGSWDVSGVTDMSAMFLNAQSFNVDLGSWDVSNVTTMVQMFANATSFNGDITGWDVSGVTDMSTMFSRATSFNQPIGAWDVRSVDNMFGSFLNATSFDADISGWDVSGATNMAYMFGGATAFSGDIGGWDVSGVTDMGYMFIQASSFNVDLSGWCVTDIATAPTGFDTGAPAWTLPRPVWGTCSPASVYQSTLSASPTSITADGTSTVTLTVQLKDVDGVNLTENTRTLTFDTPSQGSISSVTVNNDGTYTATYTAGTTPGTVTISARLDGAAMTQTQDITLN